MNSYKVKTVENYSIAIHFFAVCFLLPKKATDTLRIETKTFYYAKQNNRSASRTVFVYLINLYTYLINK